MCSYVKKDLMKMYTTRKADLGGGACWAHAPAFAAKILYICIWFLKSKGQFTISTPPPFPKILDAPLNYLVHNNKESLLDPGPVTPRLSVSDSAAGRFRYQASASLCVS